jgi:hypothetical protein
MCNPEFTDKIRELIEELVTHTDDLRLRFNETSESFHEGNLDDDVLSYLSQAIHRIEADAGGFETLLEE